jgi:hypothetical protein
MSYPFRRCCDTPIAHQSHLPGCVHYIDPQAHSDVEILARAINVIDHARMDAPLSILETEQSLSELRRMLARITKGR